MTWKKIIAPLMAIVILLSVTACSQNNNSNTADPASSASDAAVPSTFTPDYKDNIIGMKEINDDIVGWLSVPGTPISDAVLYKPDDETNEYYLRRDYDQEYSFNGVYYIDNRAILGDGSKEQLGTNTTIYGHAIADDPADNRFEIKFGPLHRFRDEAFAKAHPYIYFSTEKEDFVVEVVAVFYANADNLALPYNTPSSPEEYVKMFHEEIKPRSLYHYNTEITEDDKFITLSTCIYEIKKSDGSIMTIPYPDTYFRYAVVGKIVDNETANKTEVDFTVNKKLKIDPDVKMSK